MGLFDGADLNQLERGYQQHVQNQAPSGYTPGAPAGLLAKVQNFGSAVAHGIAQPFQDVGHGIGAAIGSRAAFKQSDYANQQASQTLAQASHLYKTGQLDKAKYLQLLQGVNDTLTTNTQNLQQVNTQANAKKVLAGGAQLATYALAPELSALKPAAALVPKIAANAVLGGAIGGESAVENNGNASDIAKGVLEGGAIGGVAGGVGGILRKVVSRHPTAATPAAPAAPIAPVVPVAPAAPQVISKAGPTVLTAPAPKTIATKAVDTYENTSGYINPQDPTAGAVSAPQASDLHASPTIPLAADAEMQAKLNQLLGASPRTPYPTATGRPVLNVPDSASGTPLQAKTDQALADHSQQRLFSELQGKTDQALAPPAAPAPLSRPISSSLDIQKYPTFEQFYQDYKPTLDDAGITPQQAQSIFTTAQNSPVVPTGASAARASSGAQTNFEQLQGTDNAAALQAAQQIQDPVARQAAIDSLTASATEKSYTPSSSITNPLAAQIRERAMANKSAKAGSVVKSPTLTPTPEKGGNFLQRVGKGLERGAVRTDLPSSPFGARREAELQSFMRESGLLKAGDNAQSVYNKLPSQMTAYQAQINDTLAKDTTRVAYNDLAKDVKAALAKENRFTGTDTASSQVEQNTLDVLKKAAGSDGQLSATEVYRLKQEVQSKLDRAYSKIEKGASTTNNEDSLLAVRNALNDRLPQQAKLLGRKESNLHDIATTIDKARKKGMRIPGALTLGLPHARESRGLAHGIQSVMSGIGVPLEKAGNVAADLGGATSGLLGKVARQAAPVIQPILDSPVAAEAAPVATTGVLNAPPGTFSLPQSTPASQPEATPTTDSNQPNISDLVSQVQQQRAQQAQPTNAYGLTANDIEQAMLQDLLTTGGANLSKLGQIHTLLVDQEKAQKPQSLNQTAVNQINTIQQAQNGLDQIEAAFSSTRNTGKGLLSKVEASPVGNFTGGGGVQDVNKAVQISLPLIAKAMGLGTSKAELEAVANQLPDTSDTQKSAQAKLNVIRSQINQYLNQYLTNQSSFAQPSNSSLDALAQVSAGGSTT